MQVKALSLQELPAWCERNKIWLHHVRIGNIEDRGNGLIATDDIEWDFEKGILLNIPEKTIISAKTVFQLAERDPLLHELLQAAGYQSDRHCVILVMVMHMIRPIRQHQDKTQMSDEPWDQYMSLQPAEVQVPTLWSETERALLDTTSLQSPLAAKMELLSREFNHIQVRTKGLPFWNGIFGKAVTLHEWIWLDALFRSRSFDLPYLGESMVPCLDMVNHDKNNTAYFQQDPVSGAVNLVLHEARSIRQGDEVTINYGKTKSAAEMLFNYGFIDSSHAVQSVVLSLDETLQNHQHDVLMPLKLGVFNALPMLEVAVKADGTPRWTAPFLFLMCLHEEDGLSFRVESTEEGERISVYWQGSDITHMVGMFDVFLNTTKLRDIIQRRAALIVKETVERQLDKMETKTTEPVWREDPHRDPETRKTIIAMASQLHAIEKSTLTLILEGLRRLTE